MAPTARTAGNFWAFWGSVGNGVSAGCYITETYDGVPQARCDRYYHAADGTITQGATLLIDHGRAYRLRNPGDAAGNQYGQHLRAGDSIRKLRFRCTDKSTAFVCRDVYTKHGFRILRHGYELFWSQVTDATTAP